MSDIGIIVNLHILGMIGRIMTKGIKERKGKNYRVSYKGNEGQTGSGEVQTRVVRQLIRNMNLLSSQFYHLYPLVLMKHYDELR